MSPSPVWCAISVLTTCSTNWPDTPRRDFRSIGHKVIYLSNGFRTLQTIGWDYAEPVLRSLVYAMLNHEGEPNPAQSDLDADRAGRLNWELRSKISDDWRARQNGRRRNTGVRASPARMLTAGSQ